MTTPNNIEELKENEVFVFGSNLNGNHGGGAAKYALENFGAIEGQREGLQGQSYAFPTLDKKMKKVKTQSLLESKEKLYQCAKENPTKRFLVTKVGCGIAGFTEEEMKEVFKGEKPNNVILPAGWSIVRGYKAFKQGLVCRDFQYELGKDFYHDGEISLCNSGFHFCKSLGDVYLYYTFGTDILVGEVESEGEVIDEEEGTKSVTNHLRIIRILNAEEASNNNGLNNIGHSNTGDWNTGHRNTGHRNTGHSNTGDWNTGDRNTGHRNTGHRNTGDWNTGDRNTGDWNTGHRNTGDWNTGHWNTGHRNTGHRNTGHSNTGDWNTGDRNTGDWNTGDRNTGDRNTGDWNTGDWNTGHRNTGHSNTGNWNTGDRNTGYLNTITPDEVLVFNKPCKREEWDKVEKPDWMFFDVNKWINFEDMTDEEKEQIGCSKYTGGYMKKLDYKQAFQESYNKASKEDQQAIKKLPNWDKHIFFEISGIMID